MKNIGTFIVLVVLLVSCQNVEKSPEPENLIPEAKMVEVLVDISLFHGARTYNKSILEAKGIDQEDYIWERHNIDSLQFARSHNYYSENFEIYEAIYDSVQSRLDFLRVKYDSLRMQEERRLDSLKTLQMNDSSGRRRPKRVNSDSIVAPVKMERGEGI